MLPKLAIWGASGHALVVADIITLLGNYEIVGFLDDVNPERHRTEFHGLSILGGKEQLDELVDLGVKHLLIAVGDCNARLRLSELIGARGFRLGTAIHPKSVVATDVSIGAGTVVCAGAVVNPGSTIGLSAIINTTASVDHECIVEAGVHIGPGAHLGGRVTVRRGAQVGIGAIVKDRTVIGANSMVGAGAVVVKDIPESVLAYGNPAKIIRRINSDDR